VAKLVVCLLAAAVRISCMGLLGEIQDLYPIPAVPLNPVLSVILTLVHVIYASSKVEKNHVLWLGNKYSFFLSFCYESCLDSNLDVSQKYKMGDISKVVANTF
jgi:hypothetical protein